MTTPSGSAVSQTLSRVSSLGSRAHGLRRSELGQLFERYGTEIVGSFYVALTGLIFGYDIGTVGALFSLDQFQNRFGDVRAVEGVLDRQFQETTQGLIVGMSCFGAMFGGLVLSRGADVIGRRNTLSVAMLTYCLGDIIELFSDHWGQLAAGRIFNGLGIGCLNVVAPMLISEFAPLELRGGLVSVQQLMTTIGILTGAVVMLCCSLIQNLWQYRIVLITGAALSTVAAVFVQWAPEAREQTAADLELANITDPPPKKEHLIKGHPKAFLRLWVGIGLSCLQQLTGINYFFFYGTFLFKEAGVSNPFLTAIILSLINLVFSCVSVIICEKLPRKTLLVSGSVGMMVSMVIFASVGSFLLDTKSRVLAGVLMILFTCIFISIFAMTWGPISGAVLSEIFSAKFKTRSMAISGATSWVANFAVSFLTPLFTRLIGFRYGFVFAGFLFASVFFVRFLVPETRNKSTEDIDEMYETRSVFN